MAAFDQLASVTASTKRGGGYDANGLEIGYTTQEPAIKCLPLDPIDPQVALGIEGLGWSEALQTAVQGGLDIKEGDLLVVAGTEYPIRAVADWTWPPSALTYMILFLEDKK